LERIARSPRSGDEPNLNSTFCLLNVFVSCDDFFDPKYYDFKKSSLDVLLFGVWITFCEDADQKIFNFKGGKSMNNVDAMENDYIKVEPFKF
jgi:hypothetical protein